MGPYTRLVLHGRTNKNAVKKSSSSTGCTSNRAEPIRKLHASQACNGMVDGCFALSLLTVNRPLCSSVHRMTEC